MAVKTVANMTDIDDVVEEVRRSYPDLQHRMVSKGGCILHELFIDSHVKPHSEPSPCRKSVLETQQGAARKSEKP